MFGPSKGKADFAARLLNADGEPVSTVADDPAVMKLVTDDARELAKKIAATGVGRHSLVVAIGMHSQATGKPNEYTMQHRHGIAHDAPLPIETLPLLISVIREIANSIERDYQKTIGQRQQGSEDN